MRVLCSRVGIISQAQRKSKNHFKILEQKEEILKAHESQKTSVMSDAFPKVN